MLRVIRALGWVVARLVLALRYRIRIHGLEKVRHPEGKTILLPNHPAMIDPVLLVTALWPAFRPRPTLYEGNFRSPLLRPLMTLLNAVRVPDLERPDAEARARARQAVNEVIEGLRRGENHILWPAGTIQRDGTERLGAAEALAEILRAVPDAHVVLARTRGLWGSRFSCAPTGRHPDLLGGLKAGAGWLLANLLFFMPRRTVDVTLEPLDRGQLPGLERDRVNRWFEAWYNAPGPEQPTYVPYHFLFGPRTFEFPQIPARREVDLGKVKPATKEAVGHILEEKVGRPLAPEELRPETPLDRLGLSSLDRMDLALAVERRFGFTGDQAPQTVAEVWALAEGLVERAPVKPPPPEWFRSPASPGSRASDAVEILGETVAEAFVARALADPKAVAVADDVSGALDYERLLVGALVLARRFARLPEANVGLLLPASAAADAALLGLYLAGKLPVVLNWTTGPANLAHAARVMGLRHVITARPFLNRVGVSVEGAEPVFVEEIRPGVGRFELLRTLLMVRWRPDRVRALVPRLAPDQPAVVLFTSGSEKAPKAVPLTHRNLLSNMRAAVEALGVSRHDSLLGFLPPFHSFGLTATGLLPLLGGVRVVRHPDPTDAAGLAAKVAGYRATLLVATPTFMGYVLDRAKPGDLGSLRLVVVGAEKCPPALFEKCRKLAPNATLLEGYGITECAPVVSVNRPGNNHPGTVGQPLPGVEVIAVDLETEERQPPGRMGMLWVSGPNVFPGYVGHDGPSPFRERDGQRWYVTGDLAVIDAEGFITFNGRLKRFLKAGGEMISLPALEEPLARAYPPTSDGPRVAVEGVELPEGRRIVLFTTEPITLREANALLQKEGFAGVMRLDEVRRVESIPVLGTGKTDYKVLRAMIEAGAKARAAV
ncbi:MAG TPA: AMP-binding protein [Gemmataceae bacterium]|nr:AMP-binding protein [Gemmataceae bacterium]